MYKNRTKTICAIALLVMLMTVLVCPAAFGESNSASSDIRLSDYEGKKIGLQAGTIYVDNFSNFFQNAEPCYFTTSPDSVLALKSGKVDAVLGDSIALAFSASRVGGIRVANVGEPTDKIAILAKKSDDGSISKYLTQFNEFLAHSKQTGEYDEIIYEWTEGPDEDRLCADYESLPDINGTITVATEPSYAPFQYIIDGRIVGLEIDFFARFCQEYGYAVNMVSTSFSSIIPGVVLGKYDLGISGFSITEERRQSVDFSDVIIKNAPALAVLETSNNTTAGFISSVVSSFRRTFIEDNRYMLFLSGALVTLKISVLSIVLGSVIGMAVHLICRGKNRIANGISSFARWLIKGMPEVVFLMVLFYIVFGNSSVSGDWVAVLGFTILFACSVHEIMIGSEAAIDPGQALAAEALGYTKLQEYFHIILPQALKFFFPSFLTEVTAHIKATAIVGYVAVTDITRAGDLIRGTTYEAIFPLIAVAVIYFILAGIVKIIIHRIIKLTDPRFRTRDTILKGVNLK